MPSDRPLRISCVICCHDSASRLAPTLSHLAAQEGLSAGQWEIVLVDNASSDRTADRARELWQALGSPAELRIVAEPKLGLIHARVRGCESAKHEILSYIDDDNWVCRSWCATVLALMTTHPELCVLGGQGTAVFDSGQAVPRWFADLAHGYAVGPQAPKSGWIESSLPRFYGAGLSIRRSALKAVFDGGFTPLCTGRVGTRLAAGEDSELCYVLGLKGGRFWYEDTLRFAHFIPADRLTEQYARKLYYGLGVGSAIEDRYLDMGRASARLVLRDRVRRLGAIRLSNGMRQFMRHRIRALLSPSLRATALIESDFFMGRLHGLHAVSKLKLGATP